MIGVGRIQIEFQGSVDICTFFDLTRPSTISLRIIRQPERYQIAHYNVNPAPVICIDTILTKNEPITAKMVESHSGVVIENGFKAGSKQGYLPGVRVRLMECL